MANQKKNDNQKKDGGNVVHTGPRGGKYILCNGKKKYIEVPSVQRIPKMSVGGKLEPL